MNFEVNVGGAAGEEAADSLSRWSFWFFYGSLIIQSD